MASRRGNYPCLVSDRGTCRPHPRSDDGEPLTKLAAQFASFLGRGHQSSASGGAGQRSQTQDLGQYVAGYANLLEVGFRHAGQHRDRQYQRGIGGLGGRFGSRFQHLAAAGGVDREHADPQLRRRPDRAGYCVRDVVVFKVEEDLPAGGYQVAHNLGPLGREELFPDLVGSCCFANGLDDLACLGSARDIERHDEPISCKHRLPV